MAQYDVFVSYNGKDREWAEQFASELSGLGVRVWFDKWELKAGSAWQDELGTAIRASASVVVLIGQSGLGPWERAELRQALNRLVRENCPVIPVILPGVVNPEVPDFLQDCHFIDYRDGQSHLERMEKLFLAITGRKLIHAISQEGEPFQIKVPGREQLISIRGLPNPNLSRRLNLSWKTFGQGIEDLRDQIINHKERLPADLCVAINDAGLVIASFLGGSIMNRCKLGYLKTEGTPEGGGRRIIEADSWLPKLSPARSAATTERPRPLILLLDSELKSGQDLKVAVERLCSEYPGARICYAVLAAKVEGQDPRITSFDDLMAGKVLQALDLNAIFIAYTFTSPGIEPPLEIR